MYRTHLEKDHGMYFIAEYQRVQTFWMKNTGIRLSIAFINSDGIIVSIKDLEPFDTRGVSSDFPAKDAIEMQRGWFRENGIRVGDKAVLEDHAVRFYRAVPE